MVGVRAILCALPANSLLIRGGKSSPGCPGPSTTPVTKAIGGSDQPAAQTPSVQPRSAAGFAACRLLKKTRGGANCGWYSCPGSTYRPGGGQGKSAKLKTSAASANGLTVDKAPGVNDMVIESQVVLSVPQPLARLTEWNTA